MTIACEPQVFMHSTQVLHLTCEHIRVEALYRQRGMLLKKPAFFQFESIPHRTGYAPPPFFLFFKVIQSPELEGGVRVGACFPLPVPSPEASHGGWGYAGTRHTF